MPSACSLSIRANPTKLYQVCSRPFLNGGAGVRHPGSRQFSAFGYRSSNSRFSIAPNCPASTRAAMRLMPWPAPPGSHGTGRAPRPVARFSIAGALSAPCVRRSPRPVGKSSKWRCRLLDREAARLGCDLCHALGKTLARRLLRLHRLFSARFRPDTEQWS